MIHVKKIICVFDHKNLEKKIVVLLSQNLNKKLTYIKHKYIHHKKIEVQIIIKKII